MWGDTNGDDGPPLVGEASLALVTQCFGDNMTDENGHTTDDVLYMVVILRLSRPGYRCSRLLLLIFTPPTGFSRIDSRDYVEACRLGCTELRRLRKLDRGSWQRADS